MGNANTLPLGLLMLAAPVACTLLAVLVLVFGRGERSPEQVEQEDELEGGAGTTGR